MTELFLRPNNIENFIGQKNNIEKLNIFTQSAKKQNKTLDHTIIFGNPGLGKTTLSRLIANLMNTNLVSISGPVVKKPSDIISVLTSIKEGEILFIDEIQRISIYAEEILYSAMEEFFIDILIGTGPGARKIKIDLPRFTLIGATTKFHALSKPLQDRFGIKIQMEDYNIHDIAEIIEQFYSANKIDFEKNAIIEIASRSRMTPRIAINYARRIFDYAQDKKITKTITDIAFEKLEIFPQGLTANDIKYLNYLQIHNKPVALSTISFALSMDETYIRDNIEAFLIKLNMIEKTKHGRIIKNKSI